MRSIFWSGKLKQKLSNRKLFYLRVVGKVLSHRLLNLNFTKRMLNGAMNVSTWVLFLIKNSPFRSSLTELHRENKLIIFKTVFQPILLYGSAVWFDCANCHIKTLQIMQNKVVKIIMNLPRYYSTLRLHERTNVNYLCYRFNWKKLFEFYWKMCILRQQSNTTTLWSVQLVLYEGLTLWRFPLTKHIV